ncbi:MAG TPA: DUF3015 family protein [Nitrospira sp.]|nr:DUF3015 family protein [Nitrospira sp.]
MAQPSFIARHLALATVLCLTFSACTVTDSLKGTLVATKDFLSSTTPGSWVTADGLLKADQKVNAFVTLNFENLTQDMAFGHGEYLTSLSELLGVSHDRRQAFFSHAQSRYQFVNNGRSGPSDLVALLTLDRPPASLQP